MSPVVPLEFAKHSFWASIVCHAVYAVLSATSVRLTKRGVAYSMDVPESRHIELLFRRQWSVQGGTCAVFPFQEEVQLRPLSSQTQYGQTQ